MRTDITNVLNISVDTTHAIISGTLGYCNVSSLWVPRPLILEKVYGDSVHRQNHADCVLGCQGHSSIISSLKQDQQSVLPIIVRLWNCIGVQSITSILDSPPLVLLRQMIMPMLMVWGSHKNVELSSEFTNPHHLAVPWLALVWHPQTFVCSSQLLGRIWQVTIFGPMRRERRNLAILPWSETNFCFADVFKNFVHQ